LTGNLISLNSSAANDRLCARLPLAIRLPERSRPARASPCFGGDRRVARRHHEVRLPPAAPCGRPRADPERPPIHPQTPAFWLAPPSFSVEGRRCQPHGGSGWHPRKSRWGPGQAKRAAGMAARRDYDRASLAVPSRDARRPQRSFFSSPRNGSVRKQDETDARAEDSTLLTNFPYRGRRQASFVRRRQIGSTGMFPLPSTNRSRSVNTPALASER
jgi:hypothetical protein